MTICRRCASLTPCGREKDDDRCALDIAESFQRGLAGIAGGGGQDADSGVFAGLADRRGHQVRQQLQRHVLEGGRRSVPKFQDEFAVVILVQLDQRRRMLAETVLTVGRFGILAQLGRV